MKFRDFILNEGQEPFLATKVGDILNAIQNLSEDSNNMNRRQISTAASGIVNQISRVLHGSWDDNDMRTLKSLQKVGVAISKAIESNDDLHETLEASVQELENTTNKMKEPINDLDVDSD